jgi:hypothetical protein
MMSPIVERDDGFLGRARLQARRTKTLARGLKPAESRRCQKR